MQSFAAFLCLLFFATFAQALPIPQSTRNVTIGFNATDVKYSSNNWEVISPESSSNFSPFTSSDVIGASFGVNLPNGTVSIQYIGVPRSGGAAYAVCIDCDLVDDKKGLWFLVDGNQPGLINEEQATPTVMFSIAGLDPTVAHAITVTNIPDTRFNNTSQIAFQSFNLTVVDNDTSNGTDSTSTSDPSQSTSTPAPASTPEPSTPEPSTSDSETSTDKPTTSPAANDESDSSSATTTSSSASGSASPTAPDAVHVKVSAAATASPSTSASSADSTAATKTLTVSTTLVAVIAAVFVLVLFCLAAALIFIFRIRRKRADARVHDAESQAYGDSQWLPPNNAMPFTGMQEVPLSATPARPRNPFEDQFAPNVPLELETPGDSTLMNKRGIRRPRSSFGNGLYGYSSRR